MGERMTDEAVQCVLDSVTCAGISAPGDHPAWRMRTDWLRARSEETRLATENAELRKQCATLEADAATAGKLLRAAQDRIDSDICSGRSHAPECDAIEEFHREDHAE